jgi:hypothetical protein
MEPRARKALGCSVLLAYLGLYAAAAGILGALLAPQLPAWGQVVYFAVAGIVWVFPLKPLFAWMNAKH